MVMAQCFGLLLQGGWLGGPHVMHLATLPGVGGGAFPWSPILFTPPLCGLERIMEDRTGGMRQHHTEEGKEKNRAVMVSRTPGGGGGERRWQQPASAATPPIAPMTSTRPPQPANTATETPPQSRQHTLAAQDPARGVPPSPSSTCACAVKARQGPGEQWQRDKQSNAHILVKRSHWAGRAGPNGRTGA